MEREKRSGTVPPRCDGAEGQVSLLWPRGGGMPGGQVTRSYPGWAEDVDLDYLVLALADGRRGAAFTRSLLLGMTRDVAVIAYRQAVFADLDADGQLAAAVEALLPALYELDQVRQHVTVVDDNPLLQVLRRLRELELYVDTAKAVVAALRRAVPSPRSQALTALLDTLVSETESPGFTQLESELPQMRGAMRKLASITVGINLDGEGRPVGAALLAVDDRPFGNKKSLIGRLFGGTDDDLAGVGIAPLHEVSPDSPSPFLQPLFRDLGEVLRLACRPVAQALGRYLHVNVTPLARLADELGFYVGAVRLARRFRDAGLPVCLPRMLPETDRSCRIVGLYNPCLALRMMEAAKSTGVPRVPVPSDVDLGPSGRVAVLTGPNMGGKTTYLQAIALAQVLAQAGLFVPGCEAAVSAVDGIYTHFPKPEQAEKALGRLGEEAQRLSSIFSLATDRSLVLLNESLASTSPGESLYLAREVLVALRLLGARVVFATHLHELAMDLEKIDAQAPGEPPTVSLVAGIRAPAEHDQGDADRHEEGDLRRTYRIEPGPPQGKSYAEEIARRHGISLSQLRQRLEERGRANVGSKA